MVGILFFSCFRSQFAEKGNPQHVIKNTIWHLSVFLESAAKKILWEAGSYGSIILSTGNNFPARVAG